MPDYTLPCSLESAWHDLRPGAVLKRLSDDRRAMFVEYDDVLKFVSEMTERGLIVVMTKKWANDSDDKRCLVISKKSYKLVVIKDPADWIVLTMGGDEALIP